MKPQHLYLLFLCFVGLFAGSCKKDFLEVDPKGKLIAKTLHDYNLMLNNLTLINIPVGPEVALSDEIIAIEPYFSGSALKYQKAFRGDADVFLPNESPFEINTLMTHIYTYNKIINEVMEASEGTELQKKINPGRGEDGKGL